MLEAPSHGQVKIPFKSLPSYRKRFYLKLKKVPKSDLQQKLDRLGQTLTGELLNDSTTRRLYSTDASVYQELPLAVAFPESESDIQQLIQFASENQVGLIPRTAGTSLAGQVVGNGIVVDVSRTLNRILEISPGEKWVRVQPGVIRDELNMQLAEFGLMFGPETSTANRAMIGGMVGNNSCGSNSIVYQTTRESTLELKGYLSDGSSVVFSEINEPQFVSKSEQATLEGSIYHGIHELLSSTETRQEIKDQFPKPDIHRRNTGYAVDQLMDCNLFGGQAPFNFCRLIAGSEGTLFFITEIKLKLEPLPPPKSGLVLAHFSSIDEALQANIIAMRHKVFASELIDQLVLEGAARNSTQRENLKIVQGNPGAILVIEVRGETDEQVAAQADLIRNEIQATRPGLGFPLVTGQDISKVWSLRKAGLGVVANVVGDEKPVAVIEDTAVTIEDLPAYITDVEKLLREKYRRECVYYAHAGSGEIHLRPVLNLKTADGIQEFRDIATDIAELVKKYRGSLSGEHGDGRLRGEFLEQMVGSKNYELMRQIKQLFDPQNIFNPGKIIDTPAMNESLRFTAGQSTSELETVFDFGETQGLQRAAEMCSGSGDCRKTELTGGTMCPSYMATRNEADSTRARANIVRHVLTDSENADRPLDNEAIKSVMDLCLSCKGCKSECPSNVDIAKIKAEFMQAYHDANGTPRRSRMIADIANLNKKGTRLPWLANAIANGILTRKFFRSFMGFHPKRSLPQFAKVNLRNWFSGHQAHPNAGQHGRVKFFCDEFTSYTEPKVGIAAIELLEQLGWQVELADLIESGRAAISKGLLRNAKSIAEENVSRLAECVSEQVPLISVEPSAILTFRDEYPDLLRGDGQQKAKQVGQYCLTFEEFLSQQLALGKISNDLFHETSKTIRLHGHCHQKALVGLAPTVKALQLPKNYTVRLIPSGCCGMAGSFGFEKEHYDLSMQIGELVLFPTVRNEPKENLICAPGTSCRHQILDGTGRESLHPAQILRDALKN
jgi:FAD/FMN-containing dehydrogenase/Fe-S oxidoreductase